MTGLPAQPRRAVIAVALPLVLAGIATGCTAPAAPVHVAQPESQTVDELLRQADAAYAAGDRERAGELYDAVLAVAPARSRAIFRLGQLAAPGSRAAIDRFMRYTQLEPRDPWGYMALGDALAAAGQVDAGLAEYAQARRLAPTEADVEAGTLRILRAAGRVDALIAKHAATTAREPGNAAAWRELGDARRRAGQHAEAAAAYGRAQTLAPDAKTLERLAGALAEAGPALRIYAGAARDSDENTVNRGGFELLLPVTERARLGARAERARVADPAASGNADTFAALGTWRPSYALRLEGAAGLVRLAPAAGAADNRALARLRLRWRESLDSPAADLRFVHEPLVATPLLLTQPVQLSEVRSSLDLPMTVMFVGRLSARYGRLSDASQDNSRTGGRAALVMRAGPTWEVIATAGTLRYARPSAAGYFAPRRVDAIELGTYFEYYAAWPLTLSADVGAGRQRVTRHGETAGDWSGTFRLWASAAWELRPGLQVALEVEHDNSQIGATTAAPTANWRSTSALVSVRLPLGGQSAETFAGEGRAPLR